MIVIMVNATAQHETKIGLNFYILTNDKLENEYYT